MKNFYQNKIYNSDNIAKSAWKTIKQLSNTTCSEKSYQVQMFNKISNNELELPIISSILSSSHLSNSKKIN